MSKLETNTIDTVSGTSTLQVGSTNTSTITLGVSGDTINVPSGVTINNNGTQTGFGGNNTPAFSAERNGAQAISNTTRTTILFNNEFYDSNSNYDTSTGKFTPTVAGKYYVSATVLLDSDSNSNFSYAFIELYKNSSVITESVNDDRGNYGRRRTCNINIIVDMNGSSDFLLIQAFIAEASGGANPQVGDMATFQAFKIIE